MEETEESTGLRVNSLLCERPQPHAEHLRKEDTGACLPSLIAKKSLAFLSYYGRHHAADLPMSLWDEIMAVSPASRTIFLAFPVCIIYALHRK